MFVKICPGLNRQTKKRKQITMSINVMRQSKLVKSELENHWSRKNIKHQYNKNEMHYSENYRLNLTIK